ncbi:MAG TPA: tryptophan 7-halogenase [Acetobacteraceae bacterium]|nr:tryptophan 7-halogenase [Acetobacteraceae bacterium]
MSGFDVLIVGAGPAGCATAMLAAQRGLSTVVLDRPRPTQRWAGESLPPGMGNLVRSVFGEDILSESDHRCAIGTRSVWGSTELVETDFLANPLGEGWILDRARFDAAARKAVLAKGVDIVQVRHIGPLTHGLAAWSLDLGDGTCLRARFLVDASGRSSTLLRRLSIRRIAADRQIALLSAYPDDGDGYCGTTVEAVAEGWWYTTPLPRGRRVLAYVTDTDLWQHSARNWHALLGETHHVGRCAGRRALSARPNAYPAGTAQAEHLAGEDWLAVGDTAMSFDPLSSQGLASAVLMGAKAGDAIAHPNRDAALAAWAEDYRMLFAEHADLRRYYARLEKRWPHSAFWRRRQETGIRSVL